MRCNEEERGVNTPAILFCFLSVFLSAVLLLMLRLYSANLECRAAETAGKIEVCRNQNALMERRCGELLSAENVYAYAIEHLNMTSSADAPVIYVDSGSVTAAKASVNPSADSGSRFFDQFNPFVNKAHAKN